MSKKKKSLAAVPVPGDDALANNFMRGFLASGMLAAFQDRKLQQPSGARVLARALQGGTALATGVATANAFQRGEPGRALAALLVGSAGIAAIEYAANQSDGHKAERI